MFCTSNPSIKQTHIANIFEYKKINNINGFGMQIVQQSAKHRVIMWTKQSVHKYSPKTRVVGRLYVCFTIFAGIIGISLFWKKLKHTSEATLSLHRLNVIFISFLKIFRVTLSTENGEVREKSTICSRSVKRGRRNGSPSRTKFTAL